MPAEIRWKFYIGNQISCTGIEINASFYILSVQVGWNATTPFIILFKFEFKAEHRAIAPPKSYPIKNTLFFWLKLKILHN